MSNLTTFILLPFFLAFLIFIFRFYVRDAAKSVLRPSFLLALTTVAVAGGYLTLGVLGALPNYSDIGVGVIGVALLAVAIGQMFMI